MTVWTDFLLSLKEEASKPPQNFLTIKQILITKGLEKNKELIKDKIKETNRLNYINNTQNDQMQGSDEMEDFQWATYFWLIICFNSYTLL